MKNVIAATVVAASLTSVQAMAYEREMPRENLKTCLSKGQSYDTCRKMWDAIPALEDLAEKMKAERLEKEQEANTAAEDFLSLPNTVKVEICQGHELEFNGARMPGVVCETLVRSYGNDVNNPTAKRWLEFYERNASDYN